MNSYRFSNCLKLIDYILAMLRECQFIVYGTCRFLVALEGFKFTWLNITNSSTNQASSLQEVMRNFETFSFLSPCNCSADHTDHKQSLWFRKSHDACSQSHRSQDILAREPYPDSDVIEVLDDSLIIILIIFREPNKVLRFKHDHIEIVRILILLWKWNHLFLHILT